MAFLRGLTVLALILFFIHPVAAAASCNDLEIDPTHVTLSENHEDRTLIITLSNEDSHQFEIDDVRVHESNPNFDIDVHDFPDEVNGNDDERIVLRYTTFDVNGDTDGTFTLEVKGEFDNSTVDCSFSEARFTIDVTIEDGDNVCSAIQVSAGDISVQEGESVTHTIRVENNSNEDFEIKGFAVFEDAAGFTINLDPKFSDDEFETIVPAHSGRTYTIDVDARNVDDDVTETAFVEIRGEFEGGADCSSTEVSAEFEVTVEDTGTDSAVCSDILLNAPSITVTSGETNTHALTLINNSAQTFFVDEYTIKDNNYQVAFEPLFTPDAIEFDSSDELTYRSTGYANQESFDSNAIASLKGHFSSGSTCTISVKRIPFHFEGGQGGTCSAFYAGIEPVSIIKGTNTLNVLFHNPLTSAARLTLALDNGTVSPAALNLDAGQIQLVTLRFSNVTQNTVLRLNTSIPGCTIASKQSELYFSGLDNAPVQFENPPSVLTIGNANEFAIQVINQSAFSQEAVITVIAKPGNESFSRTINVAGLDEPLIFLPTNILKGKSAALIQVKSAGYTVTHSLQLENAESITVLPTVSDQPNANNEYIIDVVIENNTPQTVEGDIVMEIPKGWSISGNTFTQLAPYERTHATFSVRPSVALNDDRVISVKFDSTKNDSASIPIVLKANHNPIAGATAFVTGAGMTGLGIIVILALIAVWAYSKPQEETDTEGKTGAVLSARKKGFIGKPTEDDYADEVWMTPKRK